jgi:hypothetical protein
MIPTSIDSCFEWILLADGDGIQWFIDRLVGCHLLFVPILLLLLYDFHAVWAFLFVYDLYTVR